MIKILVLIKGKNGNLRAKYTRFTLFGQSAVIAEVGPDYKFYKRMAKKLAKEGAKKILVSDKFAGNFKFRYFEAFQCTTPSKIIYDNLGKIITAYRKSYGLTGSKITLGLVTGSNAGIVNMLKCMEDSLKCIYVFSKSISPGEIIFKEFYRQTGVNVIVRPDTDREKCDILCIIEKNGDAVPQKNVLDLSEFTVENILPEENSGHRDLSCLVYLRKILFD